MEENKEVSCDEENIFYSKHTFFDLISDYCTF